MALISGNLFAIIVLVYFTKHILEMIINRRKRQGFVGVTERLDELREIPKKTIKQQLEFVNLKKPKMIGGKWSWKIIPKMLLHIIIFIILFRTYLYIFDYFSINLSLWQGILFIVVFPIIINLVLEPFNIQKGDLLVFFRRKKNDPNSKNRKKSSQKLV